MKALVMFLDRLIGHRSLFVRSLRRRVAGGAPTARGVRTARRAIG